MKEDDIQAAQVAVLIARRDYVKDLMFCAVPNASQMLTSRGAPNYRLSTYLRKQGLVSGSPDLIIWLSNRTISIENKVKGRAVSDEQKWFHDRLRGLGHEVHVIAAANPQEGVAMLLEIIGGAS